MGHVPKYASGVVQRNYSVAHPEKSSFWFSSPRIRTLDPRRIKLKLADHPRSGASRG